MFTPHRQVNCFHSDTCLWGLRMLITNHFYFVSKVTRKLSCKQILVTIGILKLKTKLKEFFRLNRLDPKFQVIVTVAQGVYRLSFPFECQFISTCYKGPIVYSPSAKTLEGEPVREITVKFLTGWEGSVRGWRPWEWDGVRNIPSGPVSEVDGLSHSVARAWLGWRWGRRDKYPLPRTQEFYIIVLFLIVAMAHLTQPVEVAQKLHN